MSLKKNWQKCFKSYLFYKIERRRTQLHPFYNANITPVPNSEWDATEKKRRKLQNNCPDQHRFKDNQYKTWKKPCKYTSKTSL